MSKLTINKTIRISEVQNETLMKLKARNIDISRFIRSAIKEKIERDYKDLKPKKTKEYCPF